MFVFINFLFALKYSSRIVDFAFLGAISYSVILFALILTVWKINNKFFRREFYWIYLCLFILGSILIMNRIEVDSLNVDRWSVITSFLNALFSGQFPYLAKSHLNNAPGPFPFYFIMASPFYFLGEIGYFSLIGFVGFVFLINKLFTQYKDKIILIILLTTSPAFLWEITVRSTLFVNIVIVLLYILWIEKNRLNQKRDLVIAGLLGGLLLSTRGIVGVILISYLSYYFKGCSTNDLKYKASLFILSLTTGFLTTIIPFIIWNYKLFFQYNPITLQANFLPLELLIIFIIFSIIIGLKSQTINDFYWFMGILLFLIVGVHFIIAIFINGWTNSIFYNAVDFSYFLFAFPFLLISIVQGNARLNER
jgi:hypothetical protein